MKRLAILVVIVSAGVLFAQRPDYEGPTILSRGVGPVLLGGGEFVRLRPYLSVTGIYDTAVTPVSVNQNGEIPQTDIYGVQGTLGVAGYVVPIAITTAGYALFQAANNTAAENGAGAQPHSLPDVALPADDGSLDSGIRPDAGLAPDYGILDQHPFLDAAIFSQDRVFDHHARLDDATPIEDGIGVNLYLFFFPVVRGAGLERVARELHP